MSQSPSRARVIPVGRAHQPGPPPDLNCDDVAPHKDFTVRWDVPDPDPHRFDADKDGVGCES